MEEIEVKFLHINPAKMERKLTEIGASKVFEQQIKREDRGVGQ